MPNDVHQLRSGRQEKGMAVFETRCGQTLRYRLDEPVDVTAWASGVTCRTCLHPLDPKATTPKGATP